ncbi:MAG: hypothetical protein K5894_03530, partial [Lachnospiraceae bacterium]|nr:hypothetical protein [Lachnospiraceae bacterium]
MTSIKKMAVAIDKKTRKVMNENLRNDIIFFQSRILGIATNADIEDYDELFDFDENFKEARDVQCDMLSDVYNYEFAPNRSERIRALFGNAVTQVQNKIENFLEPGDDSVREVLNAIAVRPANRALKGWTTPRMNERIGLTEYQRLADTTMYVGLDNRFREEIRTLDRYFPINRLAVDIQNAIDKHIKFFEKKDSKRLNAEEEKKYRKDILKEEEKILSDLKRMDSIVPGSPEAQKVDGFLEANNKIDNLRKESPRGVGQLLSDTEGRIAALRNNWPIEDIDAVAGFKRVMDRLYLNANYDEYGKILQKSHYRPGEMELLNRMFALWDDISKNPIKNANERMNKLKEMQSLMGEGIEKNIIGTGELYPTSNDPKLKEINYNRYYYVLDKAIRRELLPVETRALEEAANELGINNAEIIREIPANIPNAGLNNEPVGNNVKPPENSQEDLVRRDTKAANKRWFIGTNLKGIVNRAGYAVRGISSDSPNYVQNAFMRYILGNDEKKTGLNDCLNMNLESEKNRMDKMGSFLNDMIVHPIGNDVSPEKAAQNAEYLGKIDANAMNKILSKTLPNMITGNIEGIKNLLDENGSDFGRLNNFIKDFLSTAETITQNDPDGVIKTAYMNAFGGPKNYYNLIGSAKFVTALSSLASVAADEAQPAFVRAAAKSYLEAYYGLLKDQPLSQIDSSYYKTVIAAADGIKELGKNRQLLGDIKVPEYSVMMDYIEGKIEYPFSDEFTKKIEDIVTQKVISNGIVEGHSAVGKAQNLPLNKIYGLSYISIKDQREFTLEELKNVTAEERLKTDRIFNATLGEILGESGRQLMKTEGFEIFEINDRSAVDHLREKYGDAWNALSKEEQNFVIKAELLQAMTANNKKVEYYIPIYDNKLNIARSERKFRVPDAKVIGSRSSDIAPENKETRFGRELDKYKKNIAKLAILTKGNNLNLSSNWLKPGYLDDVLKEFNKESEKKEVIDTFLDITKLVSKEFKDDQTHDINPAIKSYAAIKEAEADMLKNRNFLNEDHPFSVLSSLADKIDISESANAIDALKPDIVFKTLMGGENKNVFDIGGAASYLLQISNMIKSFEADLNKDPDPRIEIYKKTIGLSYVL